MERLGHVEAVPSCFDDHGFTVGGNPTELEFVALKLDSLSSRGVCDDDFGRVPPLPFIAVESHPIATTAGESALLPRSVMLPEFPGLHIQAPRIQSGFKGNVSSVVAEAAH